MDFLFDIGNVIVSVDFIPSLKRLIPNDHANPDGALDDVIKQKDEFEAGRIQPEDYFPWAAKKLGFDGDLKIFMTAWTDIFTPNEPMWDVIKTLHAKGHRLILFSNIQSAHIDFLKATYPIFKKFSGEILSYQTGYIKPEGAIYQIAIDQYGLIPEKTAYIDDLSANIEGGKRAHFNCHTYRADRHNELLTWLNTI